MEVLAMAPTQHAYSDPSYTGQAPNMFLTNVGRQQGTDQRQSPFTSAGGQYIAHGPGTLSSHSTEMSEDAIDSPHMSNVSWEDFAATSWEEHARMLEQQGLGQRGMALQQNSMRFTSAPSATGFQPSDLGLVQGPGHLPGSAAMESSLSTSVSPVPDMIPHDAFISPITPSSFVPETHAIPPQHPVSQVRHRHMQSTPSPARAEGSPEISRRKSAPTQAKSNSSTSNKINKNSPKPGASQAPANSRSAHSAIERKYRENINSKIGELHKVLCSAAPPLPLFADQESEPGGYPYARVQRPDDEEEGLEGGPAGQTTLPAKKADVLAGAVAYVRRSEREKRALVDRLNAASERIRQYDQFMAQARARSLGGP